MKIKFITIYFCLFLLPAVAFARDYDFYVDKDHSGDEEGTEDEPFNTVAEAIEEAEKEEGKQEIYVKNGDYDEEITIKKNIKIFGEDEDKVILHGSVTMKDNSHLESVTVKGGRAAVSVVANADVKIENCTIRDFSPIGIEAKSGGGKLTVSGSKIKSGDGKGFYVERGKEVSIVNNEVYGNNQEGIDIRSKVEGEIKNNLVYDNDESGIELIVSSAELKISNNTIKNNGSSGIATQFYEDLSKAGEVKIVGNKISGNKNYGLDCKTPQGGSPDVSYWRDSISLVDNNIVSNKKGTISATCHFVAKEDEKTEESNDSQENDEQKNQTEEEQKRMIQEQEEKIEQMKELREAISILEKQKEEGAIIDEKINTIQKISTIRQFFIGPSEEKLSELKNKIEANENEINRAKSILEQINLEKEKAETTKEMNLANEKNHNQNITLFEMEKTFSVWGWIKEKFNRYFGYMFKK